MSSCSVGEDEVVGLVTVLVTVFYSAILVHIEEGGNMVIAVGIFFFAICADEVGVFTASVVAMEAGVESSVVHVSFG